MNVDMAAASASDRAVGELDGVPVTTSPTEIPGLIGTALAAYVLVGMRRPAWSGVARLWLAGCWFAMFELADTLHTMCDVLSARQVGAPMDSVGLAWGIQITLYDNDTVAPSQHIGRAAGGPLASAMLTASAYPLYSLLRHVPILSALAEGWLVSNGLLLGGALLPTPHFDGAALLKWGAASLTGDSEIGDRTVEIAGQVTIGTCLAVALILLVRGQWRMAALSAATALAMAADLFVLKDNLPS